MVQGAIQWYHLTGEAISLVSFVHKSYFYGSITQQAGSSTENRSIELSRAAITPVSILKHFTPTFKVKDVNY